MFWHPKAKVDILFIQINMVLSFSQIDKLKMVLLSNSCSSNNLLHLMITSFNFRWIMIHV
jgi:hypothetical protein